MSRKDISGSPYYDMYDPTSSYIQLLARPGYVAQAREFNELQSTLRGIIKSVGDSILSNGDIISGCEILINGIEGSTDKLVTVTKGRIYVEGIVMDLPQSTVTIKGVGKETIGVEIEETIIEEWMEEGAGLVDPALGYDNYGQPGCHRLKRELTVVANKSESIIIADITDGILDLKTTAPEYDKNAQLLATRTFEESGSYIVRGLKVRPDTQRELEEEDSYNIIVEQGIAYVQGFRLETGGPRRIPVKRARDTVDTQSHFPYTSGTKYQRLAGGPYIASINEVSGTREGSRTINDSSSRVPLADLQGVYITDIKQNGVSILGEGVSYHIETTESGSGESVLVWDSGKPTGSYDIYYTHSLLFIKDEDYKLSIVTDENLGLYKSHCLEWIPNSDSSNLPKNETQYTVEYTYYRARKDLVCMNSEGVIEVVEGAYADYGEELLPETPLESLVLATIENPPNGKATESDDAESIIVENIGLTRFTMQDIQNILSRVQTIQQDLASTTLNADAAQVYTENDKKGIWTDPLVDLSRIDLYYRDSSVKPDARLYDMALDLAANVCYLPVISRTTEVTYSNNDNASTRPNIYGRLMSLKVSSEQSVLSQMKATGTLTINPYSTFPQTPEVSLSPATDSWYDDTIIVIPRSITSYVVETMSSRTIDTRSSSTINNSNYATRSTTNTVTTNVGTKVSDPYVSSSEVLSERAITYIRQRTLTVEGANFAPDLKNIRCWFDDILVSLEPVEGEGNGTLGENYGTEEKPKYSINATKSGYFKATFTIPEGVLTGTRMVRLEGEESLDVLAGPSYNNKGFTIYIAEGIARTIQNTVTTVTTVLQQKTTTTTLKSVYVDPIGQTFVLDRMHILKGVDVYFSNIPEADIPVVCEIRGVSNGTINSTVYASKSLRPSDITKDNVDKENGGTKPTRFNFEDPVMLEGGVEYAFVLRSTSNAYSVWVSELGFPDLTSPSKEIVLDNPYMTGLLFSSSNNSSWTAHQTIDMKFRLIEDVYDRESIAIFEDVPVEAARIYLSADSVIPQGTALEWSFSIDEGSTYKSITPYNMILLKKFHEGTVKLKATFKRNTDMNISPLLALDTINLNYSYYEKEGWYVSQDIPGVDPYSSVKIVVETYEPGLAMTGKSPLMFYVSKDAHEEGAPTKHLLELKDSRDLNYNWKEKVYEVSGLEITQEIGASEHCRIFVNASSRDVYSTPAFRKLRVILS